MNTRRSFIVRIVTAITTIPFFGKPVDSPSRDVHWKKEWSTDEFQKAKRRSLVKGMIDANPPFKNDGIRNRLECRMLDRAFLDSSLMTIGWAPKI